MARHFICINSVCTPEATLILNESWSNVNSQVSSIVAIILLIMPAKRTEQKKKQIWKRPSPRITHTHNKPNKPNNHNQFLIGKLPEQNRVYTLHTCVMYLRSIFVTKHARKWRWVLWPTYSFWSVFSRFFFLSSFSFQCGKESSMRRTTKICEYFMSA